MRSTGPRTATGKARSALNARLHGLSTLATFSGEESELLEEMARLFAGDENLGEHDLELSRRAAAHQLTLHRAREARRQIWEAGTVRNDPKLTGATASSGASHRMDAMPQDHAPLATFNPAQHLARLVRYEGRAAYARDAAFRELEAAKWPLNDPSEY